ncbi:hypothetical protein WDZ92_52815, partial [Nostoc sp. NIES-2111]
MDYPDTRVDALIARSEGKVRNPYFSGPESRDMLGRKKNFVRQYYYHGDGTKSKGFFVYDGLSDVRGSNRGRDT